MERSWRGLQRRCEANPEDATAASQLLAARARQGEGALAAIAELLAGPVRRRRWLSLLQRLEALPEDGAWAWLTRHAERALAGWPAEERELVLGWSGLPRAAPWPLARAARLPAKLTVWRLDALGAESAAEVCAALPGLREASLRFGPDANAKAVLEALPAGCERLRLRGDAAAAALGGKPPWPAALRSLTASWDFPFGRRRGALSALPRGQLEELVLDTPSAGAGPARLGFELDGAWPELRRLATRWLHIDGGSLGELLDPARLPKLAALDLDGPLGAAGFAAICGAGLPLRELRLRRAALEDLRGLTAAPWWPQLRALELPASLPGLPEALSFGPALERLDLSLPAGREVRAPAPTLGSCAGLTALSLAGWPGRDALAYHLARAGLGRLRSLDLSRVRVTLAGLRALMEAAPQLTSLAASGHALEAGELAALGAGSWGESLVSLDLRERMTEAADLRRALDSWPPGRLRELRIDVQGRPADILALFESPALARLELLELRLAETPAGFGRELARRPLVDLRRLALPFSRLGDEELRALEDSEAWESLREIAEHERVVSR